MMTLHFLRPYWLLSLIPWFVLIRFNPRSSDNKAWDKIVDPHLLSYLMQNANQNQKSRLDWLILTSLLSMIISLSGPSFKQSAVATYHLNQPKVIVLNMSYAMLDRDLMPNRLVQAKFKLHDLFANANKEQYGLVVYTGEPFVVSPLTEDSQTIEALLPNLSPEIMPVDGDNLSLALIEAARLIEQAGFKAGQILVMTPKPPNKQAINTAKNLAHKNIDSSIIPLYQTADIDTNFQGFAEQGKGLLLSLDNQAIHRWLAFDQHALNYKTRQNQSLQWDDAGRWFLVTALLLFMPLFRKGYLA